MMNRPAVGAERPRTRVRYFRCEKGVWAASSEIAESGWTGRWSDVVIVVVVIVLKEDAFRGCREEHVVERFELVCVDAILDVSVVA